MSTLSQIRTALADLLTAQLGDVYVYRYAPDTVQAPCVIVFLPELVDLRESRTAGTRRYVLPLQLRVQRVNAETANDALDELLDQVIDGLLADVTLYGTVDSLDPYQADTFGLVEVDNGIEYLACNLHVEVLAQA